jgi:hypothetical protein
MNSIIRNAGSPICRMCKNVIIDIKYPQEHHLTRCKKSGTQCVVSGEIKYDYADHSRRNFILCGEEGKFFEPSKVEKS